MNSIKFFRDFWDQSIYPTYSPLEPQAEKILPEIFQEIMGNLKPSDHRKCALVSKKWRDLSKPVLMKDWKEILKKITIGSDKWKEFGNIGAVPLLPADIDQILKNKCPFFPKKRVYETHILVLVPEAINEKPLTINHQGELICCHEDGKNCTVYKYFDSDVRNSLGDQVAEKSHWVLITNDIIPGSRNKTFEDQKKLIKVKCSDYEHPSTLDAIASMTMNLKCSANKKKYRFGNDSRTYTRCKEQIQPSCFVLVGGLASCALCVHYYYNDYASDIVGVVALRRFLS